MMMRMYIPERKVAKIVEKNTHVFEQYGVHDTTAYNSKEVEFSDCFERVTRKRAGGP